MLRYFLGEGASREVQEAALPPEKVRALSPANRESSPTSPTSSLQADGLPFDK